MYLLDNAAHEATDRFDALAAVFDAVRSGISRRSALLGVEMPGGWRRRRIDRALARRGSRT